MKMILKWNACFLSGFLCSFEKQTLDSTDSRASVFPWYTIYLHTFRIDFGIERRGQLRNDEEWATEFDLWIQVKTIQGLNGFSETHFIGENAGTSVVPVPHKSIKCY